MADKNGMPGFWHGLLEAEDIEPCVLSFAGKSPEGFYPFGIWDGNHRVASRAITDRPYVPVVIGILKGLTLEDLPSDVTKAMEGIFPAMTPTRMP